MTSALNSVLNSAGNSVVGKGAGGPPVVPFSLNPSDKASTVVLSNSNRSAASTINFTAGTVRATIGKASGKGYVEFLVGDTFPLMSFGLIPISANLAVQVGEEAGTYGVLPDGRLYSSGAIGATLSGIVVGGRVKLAYDATAGQIWWGIVGAGFMAGGNPAAGTGAQYTGVPAGLYVAVTAAMISTVTTAYVLSADWLDPPPAGFGEMR